MTLRDLAGTRWSGQAELWLDPAGDQAARSDCSVELEGDAVRYRWSHEGKPHTGQLLLRAGGAEFSDTFHSPSAMAFAAVPGSRALVDVRGTYSGGGEEWGWRITLSRRPDGALVLQMTNVAPWGEEGRAVRMVCQRR
jgi:hypothetical protein